MLTCCISYCALESLITELIIKNYLNVLTTMKNLTIPKTIPHSFCCRTDQTLY